MKSYSEWLKLQGWFINICATTRSSLTSGAPDAETASCSDRLIRAIDGTGLEKDEIVIVSGIGCSGRISVYVDFNTLHTTHGRALTFATGIKLGNPRLNVIVIMGDGDATAIGGNHFIHAARRNLDLTAIVVNNNIYGMTGGQYSPDNPVWGVRHHRALRKHRTCLLDCRTGCNGGAEHGFQGHGLSCFHAG